MNERELLNAIKRCPRSIYFHNHKNEPEWFKNVECRGADYEYREPIVFLAKVHR